MTQQETILRLKRLNAARIAALEYDYCPDAKKAKQVADMFETGVSMDELKKALTESSGCRPDEIANQISYLIKTL
jgi:hypothetical protein